MTDTLDFASQLEKLGLGTGWEWSKGSWWYTPEEPIDVRAVTAKLVALGSRFLCITATERPDKEIKLDYQWDLDGKLLSFVTRTVNKEVASILDLIPAVDWSERETREYFAVEFTGRETTLPLMTRPGDPIGIVLKHETIEEVAK